MTKDDIFTRFENITNPDVLRKNLIMASLFITAYEIVKDTIVNKIRDYYIIGFEDEQLIYDENKYLKDVLKLDAKKRPLAASVLWLLKEGAISENDKTIFYEIKAYRNKLTHEMISFLFEDISMEVYLDYLKKTTEILEKIEKWWIINFEIPLNPDLIESDIDETAVSSGTMIILSMIIEIVFSEDSDYKYYDELIKILKKTE